MTRRLHYDKINARAQPRGRLIAINTKMGEGHDICLHDHKK